MGNKTDINLITSGGFSQRRIFLKQLPSGLRLKVTPLMPTTKGSRARRKQKYSPFVGLFYKKKF